MHKLSKKEIIADYSTAFLSRSASILGKKEVHNGRAKFGIFGDGKEIPQLAMAKVFKKGDFRSGYYRDQTFMFAIGELTLKQFFYQLYAYPDHTMEPASAGRMMNNHFGTRTIDNDGNWKNLVNIKNSASDISPNAAQMPRLLGLAFASKLFRENNILQQLKKFSNNGNEIAFGTIGNASTSEGMFFETINAAGVLQIPLLLSVWDDDYGISVPNKYQTIKESISEALLGFKKNAKHNGIELVSVVGWDYKELCNVYVKAEKICRQNHTPVLIHVTELTQPQGHSTSGSHDRYKSQDRLNWEKEHDCLKKMRQWIIQNEYSTEIEIDQLEKYIYQEVIIQKNNAWKDFVNFYKKDKEELVKITSEINTNCKKKQEIDAVLNRLILYSPCLKHNIIREAKNLLNILKNEYYLNIKPLITWINTKQKHYFDLFNSSLYSDSKHAAVLIKKKKLLFNKSDKVVKGHSILNHCFDKILERDKRVFFLGEDIGVLGGVNNSLNGLQKKYGKHRIIDTGIRECTIIGQGIGAAMRGLRPIVEIQYLDYLPYALQIISDDLATLRYRTKNGQKAPLIIRTRGHRLEGIWHSGSYMSSIINMIRGVYVLVPRNMTQAAGFYNTMLASDDSALIIERLNAYRLNEVFAKNIDKYQLPLGIPEILTYGNDITIVTYGAMCDITIEAAKKLSSMNISCEIIDVQSLTPFDLNHDITKSLKKTNKIIFVDEDVPGGATAFMLQKVLEEQKGFQYLDSPPKTITSKEHRPAYGDDGNYFSKPNVEDIIDCVYAIMHESHPIKYPKKF